MYSCGPLTPTQTDTTRPWPSNVIDPQAPRAGAEIVFRDRPGEQPAVSLVVVSGEPEADQREVPRRAPLPPRLLGDPPLERGGELDAAADVSLQALTSIAADHGPQLQRAEPPPERRPVLAQRQRVL